MGTSLLGNDAPRQGLHLTTSSVHLNDLKAIGVVGVIVGIVGVYHKYSKID